MSIQDDCKTSYVARYGNHFVTESDLLRELKYRTSWYLVKLALERKVIYALLEEHGIEDLDEEEVYEYMDSFREMMDLYTEKEIDAWLTYNNLDDEEFYELCRFEAMQKKLKDKLFPEEKLVETFAFKRLELDAVELYQLVVKDLDLAEELLAQSQEGVPFFALAHKYSIDEESRKNCGYMGKMKRCDLRGEVEGGVFSAKTGTVLGPFKGTSGYHLYLVDRIVLAEFNEDTRRDLQNDFYREFINSKIVNSDIKYAGADE